MNDQDDIPRTMEAAIQFGTVESVHGKRVRVRVGENVTDELQWIAQRAGDVRRWSPLSVGEQVTLLCPGGDTLGAVVLPGLFTQENDAPSLSPNEEVIEYPDGTVIRYDFEAHKLTATFAEDGECDITATKIKITSEVEIVGKTKITGDVEVIGKVDATGKITSPDDVVGGGKSLKTHPHTGVQSGSGVSGPPQ